MRIYYEVLPETLSRAMYRIKNGLKSNAPAWVQFTNNPAEADLQVLDCVGAGSFKFVRNPKYVLIVECLQSAVPPKNWMEELKKASLVASYIDVPDVMQSTDFNFLRMPLGVDQHIFYPRPSPINYMFLTTGYVAATESIREVYEAATRAYTQVAHVGANFNYGLNFHWFENIPDTKLNDLYNQTKFVSGLRKGEGFELPIIEGLLCGARGVCYDTQNYSYWFDTLVDYIEDGPYNFVVDQLYDLIVHREYRPVTELEMAEVRKRFSWASIAERFWEKVKELE